MVKQQVNNEELFNQIMAGYDSKMDAIRDNIDEKINEISKLQEHLENAVTFYRQHYKQISSIDLTPCQMDEWCQELNEKAEKYHFINYRNIDNIGDEDTFKHIVILDKNEYLLGKFEYSLMIDDVFKNKALNDLIHELLNKRLNTDEIIETRIMGIFYTDNRDELYKEFQDDVDYFKLDLYSRKRSIEESEKEVLSQINRLINTFNEIRFKFMNINSMLSIVWKFLEEKEGCGHVG